MEKAVRALICNQRHSFIHSFIEYNTLNWHWMCCLSHFKQCVQHFFFFYLFSRLCFYRSPPFDAILALERRPKFHIYANNDDNPKFMSTNNVQFRLHAMRAQTKFSKWTTSSFGYVYGTQCVRVVCVLRIQYIVAHSMPQLKLTMCEQSRRYKTMTAMCNNVYTLRP